jgi:hypothetical protein
MGFSVDTTLTIASGGTASGELRVMQPMALTIYAPATLPETVTVRVAPALGGTFTDFQDGGSDVTIPAGGSVVVQILHAGALKLEAGGAAAADRAFRVLGAGKK